MDNLDIAKKAVTYIVGAGTGKIVASVIQSNVASPEKLLHRVEVIGAGVVIGMMAKDATKKYTDAKFDEYTTIYREKVKPFIEKLTEQD
jgi:hypothetical protein